jgi:hypothetical protein
MKVIETTPTRLKLQHFPIRQWWNGGVAIAFSLGLLTYLIGFKPIVAKLTCDRPTPTQTNCDLKHHSLLRQINHFRIFDPQRTEIITRTGSKGSRSYEIRMISTLSDQPFMPEGSGSLSENQEIAAKIDGYIKNPQTRSLWVHQQDQLAFLFILGALGVLASGVSMTLTPTMTCNFYKRMDKLIIERKRWNHSKTIVEERLHNILTAELEERQAKYTKVYRVMLVMASADRLPLHSDFTSEPNARKALYSIQKFLQTKSG